MLWSEKEKDGEGGAERRNQNEDCSLDGHKLDGAGAVLIHGGALHDLDGVVLDHGVGEKLLAHLLQIGLCGSGIRAG